MIAVRRVLVVATAIVAAGCGSSGGTSSVTVTAAPGGSSESATSEAADGTEPGTSSESTAAPDTNAAASGELAIESGFTVDTRESTGLVASAGAKVSNPGDKAACGVQVVFTLKGPDGAALDTTTENVSWIPAGDFRLVAPLQIGFQAPAAASALEVTTVVESYEKTDDLAGCHTFTVGTGTPLQVAGVTIVREQYFDKITGQVTNQTDKLPEFPLVNCVMRAAGAIVGGESTGISDPIAPGHTIAFEVLPTLLPKAADAAECQVVA